MLDGAMDADAGRELLRDVCGCCQRTLVTGLLVSLNCCSDSAVLARRMSCTCTQPALVPSASSVPSCLADRLLKELPRGAAMLHTAFAVRLSVHLAVPSALQLSSSSAPASEKDSPVTAPLCTPSSSASSILSTSHTSSVPLPLPPASWPGASRLKLRLPAAVPLPPRSSDFHFWPVLKSCSSTWPVEHMRRLVQRCCALLPLLLLLQQLHLHL